MRRKCGHFFLRKYRVNQRLGFVRLHIADNHQVHIIGVIPSAVERLQCFCRHGFNALLRTDDRPTRITGIGANTGGALHVHACANALPRTPFFLNNFAFIVQIFLAHRGMEHHLIQYIQGKGKILRPFRRAEHIGGGVRIGYRIITLRPLPTSIQQHFHHALRILRCAAKHHVLHHVRAAHLRFRFVHRTGIYPQANIDTVFLLMQRHKAVTQAISQLTLHNFRRFLLWCFLRPGVQCKHGKG